MRVIGLVMLVIERVMLVIGLVMLVIGLVMLVIELVIGGSRFDVPAKGSTKRKRTLNDKYR